MKYREILSDEEIENLKKEYGYFWEDAIPTTYGIKEHYINLTYHFQELETELYHIHDQVTRNVSHHTYLCTRAEEILDLMENITHRYINNNDNNDKFHSPQFYCHVKWEKENLKIETNHLLPKMKKTFKLQEYQELRDFYIPRIVEKLLEKKPNNPMDDVLIYIKQIVPNKRPFDIDNRFRSFLLDALVRGGIIVDDDINNLKIFEDHERVSNISKTQILVIPKENMDTFFNKINCKQYLVF